MHLLISRLSLLSYFIAAGLMLAASPASAHGKLDATEIEERFTDTTQLCRKEKDMSTCTTYFAENGEIKRRLHDTGKRRQGVWETDLEHNQLCITWEGKDKPLCLDVYQNKDGTLDLYKGSKHLSTVLNFIPGNVERL